MKNIFVILLSLSMMQGVVGMNLSDNKAGADQTEVLFKKEKKKKTKKEKPSKKGKKKGKKDKDAGVDS